MACSKFIGKKSYFDMFVCAKKPTKNVEKQYFLMFFLVNFKILLKDRFFHINVNIVFNFFYGL